MANIAGWQGGMAMGVNLFHKVWSFIQWLHVSLHVEQVLADIYVGGAIRTAGDNVMPCTTQHTGELKC